ncbi:Uma2 family endonuclease [Streptomyces sp. DG2A-72]|uniref:Uma2 family endonuclease n=1 Tax=Streptomyces sp. DG2A-72 TaxID=3051386 RepID=UPI00265C76D4|nr:Uma2 family endonuclease [Streptomyces sp. DG2A-72]MDO0935107.1 Uma2 family endonuclease [Streptomyces sp. DG2A-72]
MFLTEFEELARVAPEMVQLEFIDGRLEVRPTPDGGHLKALERITDACRHLRPELDFHQSRGIKVGEHASGRAWLDGALAPARYFANDADGAEWADPDGVLMAVTVVMSTDRRDPVALREAYAAARIPVYLVVDRADRSAAVFFEPMDGRYRSATMCAFGSMLRLPEPVGVNLRTAVFDGLEEEPAGAVRISTEVAAQYLADLRQAQGAETDEEAVRKAVMEAARRIQARERTDVSGQEEL